MSATAKILIVATSAFVACLMALTAVAIRADGKPTYCYIIATSYMDVPHVYHKLHAFRPWRSDVQVGIFDSHESAVKAAELMTCPLR